MKKIINFLVIGLVFSNLGAQTPNSATQVKSSYDDSNVEKPVRILNKSSKTTSSSSGYMASNLNCFVHNDLVTSLITQNIKADCLSSLINALNSKISSLQNLSSTAKMTKAAADKNNQDLADLTRALSFFQNISSGSTPTDSSDESDNPVPLSSSNSAAQMVGGPSVASPTSTSAAPTSSGGTYSTPIEVNGVYPVGSITKASTQSTSSSGTDSTPVFGNPVYPTKAILTPLVATPTGVTHGQPQQ